MCERERIILGRSIKNGFCSRKGFTQVVNTRRMTIVREGDDDVLEKAEMLENAEVPIKKKKYRMIRRHPATIFDCTECGKTFKHPSKIAEHMRIHTGEKPFRCEMCGVGFSQGNSLKVHLRIHRGERPFSCDYCDRDFFTSSQKKSHEKIHLRKPGAEPLVYVCPAEGCTARYARKERMASHIQTSHPEMCEVVEEVERKRIVINSVEDLIEQVNEPEDVYEEQIWEQPSADSEYYTEGMVDNRSSQVDDENCFANPVERRIITLAKDDSLEPALNEPTVYIEETVDIIDDEDEALVGTCQVEALPAVVAEELMEAVDVGHEGAEHIYVENEEVIDDIECRVETVYHYVNGEGYYEPAADDQNMINEDVGIPLKNEGMLEEGEVLIDETSLVEEPTVSYIEEVDDMNGYVYAEPPLFRPPVITRKRRLKRSEQGLLAGTHHLEIDPVINSSEGSDGKESRHKIVADVRPPRKGRRKSEGDSNIHKLEVDPAIFEMAAPVKRTREATERLIFGSEYLYRPRPSRNLDWIIDAVAKGEDVDKASPHNRRKPQTHQCEYCGRIDKYPSKIQAHMRTHTGERPFKCDICGLGFSQRTPMRMHVRRHLNQRPYVCDIGGCGERFINGSLLNAHQNAKHFERKRYACLRGCGRSFAQARDQRKHAAKCTNRPVDCDLPYQTSSMLSGYNPNPGMRMVENAIPASQKFVKIECEEFNGMEERHRLNDQFLETTDEQVLLENQQLETFDERLIGQDIDCGHEVSTIGVMSMSNLKQEEKQPEEVFVDTRQNDGSREDEGWLL